MIINFLIQHEVGEGKIHFHFHRLMKSYFYDYFVTSFFGCRRRKSLLSLCGLGEMGIISLDAVQIPCHYDGNNYLSLELRWSLARWADRHRKIWKLNVADDKREDEIKGKLSGDKNFDSRSLPVASYRESWSDISSSS